MTPAALRMVGDAGALVRTFGPRARMIGDRVVGRLADVWPETPRRVMLYPPWGMVSLILG